VLIPGIVVGLLWKMASERAARLCRASRLAAALEVRLPVVREAAAGAEEELPAPGVVVVVDASGRFHLEGRPCGRGALRLALQNLREDSLGLEGLSEGLVEIAADAQAPWRHAEVVLADCLRARIWRVAFTCRSPVGRQVRVPYYLPKDKSVPFSSIYKGLSFIRIQADQRGLTYRLASWDKLVDMEWSGDHMLDMVAALQKVKAVHPGRGFSIRPGPEVFTGAVLACVGEIRAEGIEYILHLPPLPSDPSWVPFKREMFTFAPESPGEEHH
jgi:biopolymer transport protein ExbD